MYDYAAQNLQDQIGQLSKLLGGQTGQAQLPPSTTPAASQYDEVNGLEGARDFLKRMLPGTKRVVWDSNEPVFYALATDANGCPQRIQICKFTVELEPTPEEKFVTREDFNSLAAKIDLLLAQKKEVNDG